MKSRHVVDLLVLGALWGASFLFMRQSAPEFGPIPLIALRVALASLFLIPILLVRRVRVDIRGRWRPLAIVGVMNSALPFCLFAFATLSVSAGFAAILNATAPLFGAIVAFFWLQERLSWERIVGLCVGFLGIVILVSNRSTLSTGGNTLAVAAALGATFLYGAGANYAKRYLADVHPLAVATGSQIAASLALFLPALYAWPAETPGWNAWVNVLVLAVACTGFAYILFFRLISNIGPSKAITVTFLIPLFGMLWGVIFLHEEVTLNMMASCGVIIAGTGLATGFIRLPQKKATAH
ncbi:DMT family transporter [Oligoflexus tunisiensis]|uniref:DMT family transporter n=1 Tax=Oligoflexus tunisiensis TaxID=708132 RepID=UPI000B1B9EBD|nr:DMT family transporter [Oligoflexus tunisiensis]